MREITLVSVVIPTYDRANVLPHAIESALAQTHRETEVIVVDDGSTDDTGELVAERSRDEPRLRYLRQDNAGVAAARNRGLDAARGDVIAFLDSDDSWRPWKLALQLECLRRVPSAGAVWTNVHIAGSDGAPDPGSSLRDLLSGYDRFPIDELFAERIPLDGVSETIGGPSGASLYAGDIYSQMVVGNLMLTPSTVLTRERLQRVGRFDESFEVAGEDFEFFLRTCRAGPVAFVDVPAVLVGTGTDDRLTHPSKTLWMARNYLRTMDDALLRDPGRIDLPRAILRDAHADAYAWLGAAYLRAGDAGKARESLRRSLRLRPRDGRSAAFALLSLLGDSLGPRALGALRRALAVGAARRT